MTDKIRIAKSNYYKDKLNQCGGNTRDTWITNNNLISNTQHGFQVKKPTRPTKPTALIELTDYIHKSFDSRQYVIALFLDFSKAFDTVEHSIFLRKLEHSGGGVLH